MTRYRRPWTEADRDLLRRHFPTMPTPELATLLGRTISTVYQNAYKLGLRKSDTYFAAGLGGRTGDGRGAATRFKPGQPSWNKGQRYIAGGRSAETRFKPGQLPHTWRPVGAYRIRADKSGGYLEQKITDTHYTPRDWVPVHRLVDLRNHLFLTLEKLNDEDNPMDLERARTVADVAQVLVNSAKIEVEHMKVAGRITGTDFIPLTAEAIDDVPVLPRRTQ